MTRLLIDRTTSHYCERMAADYDYLRSQGQDPSTCVNCERSIPQRYAQDAVICQECRRECLDDLDVRTETCVWCGAEIEAEEVTA